MSEQESLPEGAPDDPLTGHSYDGIQEYDNPLPGWWKWLFVASIVMAPPYFMYYHSGVEGRSVADQYDTDFAAHIELQFAEIGNLAMTRESVIEYLYDDSWLKVGKSVFKTNCTQCHAKDGGGLVGPNLTDEEYKNVKDIGDILAVIQNGANGGAMPAWNNRLSENQMVLVSSYVASLRGTTPAKAKEPEGRKIDPWPPKPAPKEEQPDDQTAETQGSPDAKTPGETSDDSESTESNE